MGYYLEAERLEPPEAKEIGRCSVCGGEIYAGQSYGTDGVRLVHSRDEAGEFDCINDEFMSLTLDQRFNLLGYEIKSAAPGA